MRGMCILISVIEYFSKANFCITRGMPLDFFDRRDPLDYSVNSKKGGDMKQRGWILSSGATWFIIGIFLMYKGLRFVAEAQMDPESLSFRWNHSIGSANQASNWIIFFALIVGFAKGRFVFVKTVNRVVSRIRSLSLPIRFSQVYTKSYWILIGSMMMLGMLFRFLPIPIDIRGFVDVAIGSALMNGAMLYFRAARTEAA